MSIVMRDGGLYGKESGVYLGPAPVFNWIGTMTHDNQYVEFRCPGCQRIHILGVGDHLPPGTPQWRFNGDVFKPVLGPSINAVWDSLSLAARERNRQFYQEHGRYMTREELPHDRHHVCHSFVGCNGAQPGEIIFLGDCTHENAGKVMALQPWSDDFYDQQPD